MLVSRPLDNARSSVMEPSLTVGLLPRLLTVLTVLTAHCLLLTAYCLLLTAFSPFPFLFLFLLIQPDSQVFRPYTSSLC